jgi:hypothetical protein
MLNIKKAVASAAATGALLASTVIPAFAATTVVTETSTDWTTVHSTCSAIPSTGSQVMEEGPATPPAPTGSREFRIGVNGDSFEQYRNDDLDGLPLSQLTTLTYSTYVEQFGSGDQAPYINLLVDQDGNPATTTDQDQLFFEPVYQTGTYGGATVPNQGNVVLNTWQTWDADSGGWWALSDGTFGPPLITLQSYLAEYPNAIVRDTTSGSIRLVAGCGGAAWANFIGNADNVTINGTTYNFELAQPGPVVNEPTSKDACKNGGWQTFTDSEGKPFKNQGQCVSYVASDGKSRNNPGRGN